MGCCNSVRNNDTKNVSENSGPSVSFPQLGEAVHSYHSSSEGKFDSSTTDFEQHSTTNVGRLVLEFLDVLRTLNENEEEAPECLKILHDMAEKENGWLDMVMACIENTPMESDLGPAVISVLLDECSLVSKETIGKLLSMIGLTSDKQQVTSEVTKRVSSSRNIAIVLGCLADKLAGPQGVCLLPDAVLEFLLNNLSTNEHPSVVLFSIITFENLAKSGGNKQKIESTRICENLSVLEKTWIGSKDHLEHQAAFCAQWCLDTVFLVEGRSYSYENTNLEGVNAMLNVNDVSNYLKISPNGLEARSDAFSFESVRSTYSVESGTWFYEVTILTSGVMQIGWATKESRFLSHEGYGIGDDTFSIAFDGCRQLLWHDAGSEPVSCLRWRPGDILGLLLKMEENKVIFYLNGIPIEKDFPTKERGAFFAAASFMSFQHCKFNFGAEPFIHPPSSIQFDTFNNHATLSEDEKKVLPRHIKMTSHMKPENFHADSCTICYETRANAILHPCRHGDLCSSCANQMQFCPLCRATIESVQVQTITEV